MNDDDQTPQQAQEDQYDLITGGLLEPANDSINPADDADWPKPVTADHIVGMDVDQVVDAYNELVKVVHHQRFDLAALQDRVEAVEDTAARAQERTATLGNALSRKRAALRRVRRYAVEVSMDLRDIQEGADDDTF